MTLRDARGTIPATRGLLPARPAAHGLLNRIHQNFHLLTISVTPSCHTANADSASDPSPGSWEPASLPWRAGWGAGRMLRARGAAGREAGKKGLTVQLKSAGTHPRPGHSRPRVPRGQWLTREKNGTMRLLTETTPTTPGSKTSDHCSGRVREWRPDRQEGN